MPTMKIGIGPSNRCAGIRLKSLLQRAITASNRASFVLGPVFQALMHHRIGALQRRPGLVVTTQVLEFLVLSELERGVVLGALLHVAQPSPDEIQVIIISSPLADSCKRQRCATESRPELQAGLELGLRFRDTAVELQLDRAEVAEIRVVEPERTGPVHERERFHVQVGVPGRCARAPRVPGPSGFGRFPGGACRRVRR
jgi:hypothetical protein